MDASLHDQVRIALSKAQAIAASGDDAHHYHTAMILSMVRQMVDARDATNLDWLCLEASTLGPISEPPGLVFHERVDAPLLLALSGLADILVETPRSLVLQPVRALSFWLYRAFAWRSFQHLERLVARFYQLELELETVSSSQATN